MAAARAPTAGPASSWRGHETIADAANGLNEQRIGGITLDLAAQAIHLHVNGALVHRSTACERKARHRLARLRAQHPKHLALAIRQPHNLLTLAQFAALDMEDVG